MNAWKNEKDYETFKSLNSQVRKLREINTEQQIKMSEECNEKIKNLEKQSTELWSKNH